MLVSAEDRQVAADKILLEMKNPFTRAYFLFLKYTLNDLNFFNALFQSAKILIGGLKSECEKFIKTPCDRLDVEKKICEMKNFTDKRVFPDLAELAERVLSLPHPNADSERIFQ